MNRVRVFWSVFSMLFEFDHAKSAANKQKYGIDFKEATALWEDDSGLEVPAKDQAGERRLARVALLGTKVWFCVYTMRGETVRIVSVRRARDYEKARTGAKAKISAEEFDQLADSGSDKIDRYLDWENARRPALEIN